VKIDTQLAFLAGTVAFGFEAVNCVTRPTRQLRTRIELANKLNSDEGNLVAFAERSRRRKSSPLEILSDTLGRV
jgi:hypothetical protein